jgi:DNA-binding beta-propeller fold protein YncE
VRRLARYLAPAGLAGTAVFAAGCIFGGDSCPDTPGAICTWAGTGEAGFNGDGIAIEDSRMYAPVNISFLSSGTYVLDWNNHIVRVVEDGTFRTVMGSGFVGDGPPDLGDLEPPGSPGVDVDLNHPTQILEWEGRDEHLLVAWHNHKFRSYHPDTGLVVVECGLGPGFDGDGPVEDARFNQPSAARFGPDGALYLVDQRNQRIRRIDTLGPGGSIETVIGTGDPGFSGDGASPIEAQVRFPSGSNPPPAGTLDFDEQGRLYFSDTLNNRIRRVDFDADVIETVLGDGDTATLSNPRDVERGPDGRLYIADEFNHRVLALHPETLDVEVIAGTGVAGFEGDGGSATQARLNHPSGLAFDAEGNLYIADRENHRIRMVRGGF